MSLATFVHRSVNRLLPAVLVRALTMVLTDIMTRNIVHTLAPSLTFAMGQPSIAKFYCYYCRYYGTYCHKCYDHSPVDMAPALHLADYYASYYGDYYAEEFKVQRAIG